MQEETTQALLHQQWEKSIPLLQAELQKEPVDSGTLAYNLVVCLLKIKKPDEAEQVAQRYISYMKDLPQADIEQIRKEIKESRPKKERKQKESNKTISQDGQIKQLAWFKSDTTFAQVIGLGRVKNELSKRIIGAMQNPDLYERYGGATSGGIILYGSPGSGKTLLARAVAGEAGGRMLIVNISEIVSKYMGDSSRNLSLVFSQARQNLPALIFIDEIDSVAQSRASTSETTTSPEERRILDTFLTELDGVAKNNKGVFLLGSSNIPWACDSAFLRSGRFGKSIYVSPPSTKDRIALFKFYLKNKNIKNISYLKLGLLSFGMSCADILAISENAATQKAANTHFNKAPEVPITTTNLIREIRMMGKPTLISWFAETAVELEKLPVEKRNQYRELINDITFWQKNGKPRMIIYKVLGSLIPTMG